MIKSRIKFLILTLILLVIILSNTCFAAVAVTEENLKAAFLSFQNSEANEEGYGINMSNNIIRITSEGETYNLSYDISGEKPTFTYEVPIQKGMSYEDYQKKCGDSNIMLPMIGYIGVANIQGVKLEDSATYFALSYLSGALGGGFTTNENTYVIVDDMNMSDGVTINKDESSPNTIYTSEFGDRVMEFVNSFYKEKQTIQDTTGINSYVMTVERKDVTETSCKIVATLSVNLDADFSKIMGTAEGLENSFNSTEITKENADYVIELKVGQKCKLAPSEKIKGYEKYGGSCVEFSDDRTEITALKVGNAQGYIYVEDIKKSFYIIVEENTGSAILETITVNIDSAQDTTIDKNTIIIDDEEDTTSNKVDNEDTSSDLPQTGLNNFILIASIIIGVITIIITGIKMKKYKEVK